jgi:hypothetical protein
MPPFQSRSAGASRTAFISSAGVMLVVPLGRPSAAIISAETGIALSDRAKTPPPAEIRLLS